jgi:hypothetical protein
MRRLFSGVLAVLALLVCFTKAQATIIIIDDFGPAAGSVSVPPGSSSADFVAGGLGGERDLFVSRPSGASASLSIAVPPEVLEFQSNNGGGTGRVIWDGSPAGDDPTKDNKGLSNINFLPATGQVFWLKGFSNQAALYSLLTIELTVSDASNIETRSFGSFQNNADIGGFVALLPFSLFTTVNLGAVKGITLTISGDLGGQIASFDAIGAGLPEPASWSVFGLLGIPAIVMWRKKRAARA